MKTISGKQVTNCRKVIDHNIWDKISQIFKHFVDGEHKAPILYEFSILGGNYRRNKFRRKVSE